MLLLSSLFSDKETEARRGQILGNLFRPLLWCLGIHSASFAAVLISSAPSLQPSSYGSAGAELLRGLLSCNIQAAAFPHPCPLPTLKQKCIPLRRLLVEVWWLQQVSSWSYPCRWNQTFLIISLQCQGSISDRSGEGHQASSGKCFYASHSWPAVFPRIPASRQLKSCFSLALSGSHT